MSKRSVSLTHKGWFLPCPVYFGDLDSDAPLVEPRRSWCGWLMDLSLALFHAFADIQGCFDPSFDPAYPLLKTGKLANPKVVQVDDKQC